MDEQVKKLKSDTKLKIFDGGLMREHKPVPNYEIAGQKIIITHDEFVEVRHNDFARLFEHICKRLRKE